MLDMRCFWSGSGYIGLVKISHDECTFNHYTTDFPHEPASPHQGAYCGQNGTTIPTFGDGEVRSQGTLLLDQMIDWFMVLWIDEVAVLFVCTLTSIREMQMASIRRT